MAVITMIKRRCFGKGNQLFKKVVLPSAFVLFLFHFLFSSNSDISPEENMIVPGEALDPIIKLSKNSPKVDSIEIKPHIKEAEKQIPKDKMEEPNFKEIKVVPPASLHRSEPKRPEIEKPADFPEPKKEAFDDDIPPRMETKWSMAKAKVPDMEKVKFKGHAITNDTITLTLMSSADKVFISINKKEIYRGIKKRGLHVVVLNQYNGRVMAKRVFDTFQMGVEEDFVDFIGDITAGRIIILAVLDEVSTGLTWKGRNQLKELGSRFSSRLAYRDMWAMVTRKDGLKIAETYSNVATADTGYEWGGPIFMRTDFDLEERPVECQWPYNERNQARRSFCVRYEGYGKLCNCDVKSWDDVFFPRDKELHKELQKNPLFKEMGVIILATNRPHSLYRLLKSLYMAPGFNEEQVTIYTESSTREINTLARLFGVTVVETNSYKNATVPQKIRHKMQRAFRDIFGAQFRPDSVPKEGLPEGVLPPFSANSALILEEDLVVAIDIFKYLYAIYPIFNSEPTIVGISAFNFHGFRDVIESQTNSYRTSQIVNLAVLFPIRGVVEILVPNWPQASDEVSEWTNGISKVQGTYFDFIYPEIPRAKHSSYEGYIIEGQIHQEFFKNHMLSLTTQYEITEEDVDKLKLTNYYFQVVETIKKSTPMQIQFCDQDLYYGHDPKVVYVRYDGKDGTDLNYVLKCLKTWFAYPVHGWRDMWQFHYHGRILFVVGVPASPFTELKAADYQPLTAPPGNTTTTDSTSSTTAKAT